jgi:hypothetical protein
MYLVWSKKLAPTDTVGLGERYRAEVRPEPHAGLHCIAALCHRRGDAGGVETREELPLERLPRRRAATAGQHRKR